jgi:superfamily II DNA or RNA helicase
MLTNDSLLADHPINIDIQLKKHQLALLQRCLDIEKAGNKFGIMNDKPGTGKTFVILSLIYQTIQSNTNNIIVVPQNIYTQWIENLERFSNRLCYLKLINYDNILSLYNDPSILFKYNIILITSSFYHILSTTLESLNIYIDRVFFDEIDSISNLICNKINSKFIWFISASFNINSIGCYNIDNVNNINDIICNCDNNFIDNNILLEEPSSTYYHCKNIYIDNILENIISEKELLTLNAMDYSLYKVTNEKEVIETILKDKKNIIQFNKSKIEDANKNIEYYQNFIKNKDIYIEELSKNIKNIDVITMFKKNIINFIIKYDDYANLYINYIYVEDKEADKLIKDSRKEQMKKLRLTFDTIIDILYYIKNEPNNNLLIKKLFVIFESIEEIITKLKIINVELLNFNDMFIETKNFINNLFNSMNNSEILSKSIEQLNIYKEILETSTFIINENEIKIKLIYERLKDNNCCPICYEIFNDNDKVFITSKCCNNKICKFCIGEWYNVLKKTSCIYCNTLNIYMCDNVYYINENNSEIIKDNLEVIKDNSEVIKDNSEIIINNIISLESSKNDFLDKYLNNLKNIDKKVIIFSDYSSIFDYIEKICNNNDIKYVDLDKGNINDIDKSIYEYKYGNAKILLSNSTLFGCGMNLENSSDIIFVHKMNKDMEKQVIGRAQRLGRKSKLNIIYLLYENESEVKIIKKKYDFNLINLEENSNYSAYDNGFMSYNLDELPSYETILDINLESLINNLT